MDDANNPKGWTDREILSSLLYLIQKDNITLDWDGGLYAAGRTVSGFRQKTNKLIKAFRSEWDAMASGAPVPQATPKKAPATSRKRKSKADQEDSEDVPSVKKPRGRPRKKAAIPKSEDDEADLDVKAEPKEEEEEEVQIDDIDAEV
ncbi:hypothetical protein GGP41_008050 [Bipolaris sorokiniana]|uniref:Uncharacterized protein n=2 Tax=Cochliobolus sativus TaxID=45130 RepID=A0A8H5ZL23_COCSA|nr:uncharacterized protein COCSADRAFT_158724 [Bipolaris sorokiniana ND90Pr]EMD66636.1 hypothetical protein COCSADRAFT_158724 [Bipolaris sorokiniana ND90Pr]KAF5852593.1 hypothetical protein GGP41_008050 [Bipolaris sorokiniana]